MLSNTTCPEFIGKSRLAGKNLFLLIIAFLLLQLNSAAQNYNSRDNSNLDGLKYHKIEKKEVADSNITQLSHYPMGMCNFVYADSQYAYINNGLALEILDLYPPEFNPNINPKMIGRLITESSMAHRSTNHLKRPFSNSS